MQDWWRHSWKELLSFKAIEKRIWEYNLHKRAKLRKRAFYSIVNKELSPLAKGILVDVIW